MFSTQELRHEQLISMTVSRFPGKAAVPVDELDLLGMILQERGRVAM